MSFFCLRLHSTNLKIPLLFHSRLSSRPLLSSGSRLRKVSYFPAAPRAQLRHLRSEKLVVRTMATLAGEKSQSTFQVEVRDKIDLSETEKKIFDRLLSTLRYFNLQTQLRVAGGWVRDKLLGKDCYDIDIAIDNMMGSEFLDKVKDYLSSTGEEVQGFAVIPCNPDQSKHLETARMRLFDLWIDFVNLRCEEYCESSRIPTMKFGTAEEDAYRRDLTINSLFYNINTGLVEDLTQRGIADLKSGRIVTPLPAKATFLDDPLRVLRAIRFGARFDFILDEELKQAAAEEEVKKALEDKISKERIGIEIDLMMSGNQPVKAVSYICDLTLFGVVFRVPPPYEARQLDDSDRLCLAYLNASWNLIQLIGTSKFSGEQKRLALYAALFLPFRKDTFKDNKGKKIPVVNYIFKDSLKRKSNDSETVINVHRTIEKFIALIPSLESSKDIEIDKLEGAREFSDLPTASKVRIAAGFVLRQIKDFWRVALLTSLLVYPNDINGDQDLSDLDFELDKKRELYLKAEKTILELDLDNIWDQKPLVDGRKIMSVLELKSGGPLVREWQQKLLAWQLAHPSGTEEECLDWMKHANSKRIRME